MSCGTLYIVATFALILILEGMRGLLPRFYSAAWLLLMPVAVA